MNRLDNKKLIAKLDLSNMLDKIANFPEQGKDAYDIGLKVDVEGAFAGINNIVFTGLGASAIGADIVKGYLQDELNFPVLVCRNYTLPKFVNKSTLLLCLSYSGNTEEAVFSCSDGLKKGAKVIVISSGGRLKEVAIKNRLKYIEIPDGYPPRAALGYLSITALAVLARIGLIGDKKQEISGLYSALSVLRDREIGVNVCLRENPAKKLAEKLYGKYSIIYGTSDTTEAVALRWRAQISENAKSLSSTNVFPEMNHNEIVGWGYPKKLLKYFKVIILRDKKDHVKTQKSIDISKDIISKAGVEVFEFKRDSPSLLERIFSLIYIGDFVSFYLGILNNTDPTPVKRIDYLKAELAKFRHSEEPEGIV